MNLWDVARKDKGGKRDRFISRFFGIFSEEIAGLYFEHEKLSKYQNLGRPTIKKGNDWRTLDFTLKHKETNKIYICEMKCEMQYQNFSRLELESSKQIEFHKAKEAFKWFLEIASNKNAFKVEVNDGGRKNEVEIDGIILLWGKTDEEKLKQIQEEFNIHDILSLEKMIN